MEDEEINYKVCQQQFDPETYEKSAGKFLEYFFKTLLICVGMYILAHFVIKYW